MAQRPRPAGRRQDGRQDWRQAGRQGRGQAQGGRPGGTRCSGKEVQRRAQHPRAPERKDRATSEKSRQSRTPRRTQGGRQAQGHSIPEGDKLGETNGHSIPETRPSKCSRSTSDNI